ncbi:hypothetical protein [Bradyrhizobium sp. LHD-71]|uniref:hypothetical protein n=1 Tax=Bradyrhizobium sp. LHD-71 TaxID=3072141 RepID=UPI00280EF828|nr:hypothetical protein [Bradyrhizobium sp. LHD-71]MDQ8727639.1 hypothetical protein [Bradyrhizobium sp. LHD-71]
MRSLIDGALVAAVAIIVPTVAPAQTTSTGLFAGQRLSVEVTGGTTEVARDRFAAAAGTALTASLHSGPTGKKCLTVAPQAKSQKINPAIYDHILSLENTCAQTIRIRACYFNTTRCTIMSVGGYRRELHNLGIFPSKDFRYAYREFVD